MKTKATPAEVLAFLTKRKGEKFTVVKIAKENHWTVSNVTQAVSRLGNIKVDSMKQNGNCGARFVYYVDPVDVFADRSLKPMKISTAMQQAMERCKELYPEGMRTKFAGA